MYAENVDQLIRRDIGDRIRARRLHLDLSQVALAQRLGVQQREISRWETGSVRPSGANLYRLAEELDCDWQLFAYGQPGMTVPAVIAAAVVAGALIVAWIEHRRAVRLAETLETVRELIAERGNTNGHADWLWPRTPIEEET